MPSEILWGVGKDELSCQPRNASTSRQRQHKISSLSLDAEVIPVVRVTLLSFCLLKNVLLSVFKDVCWQINQFSVCVDVMTNTIVSSVNLSLLNSHEGHLWDFAICKTWVYTTMSQSYKLSLLVSLCWFVVYDIILPQSPILDAKLVWGCFANSHLTSELHLSACYSLENVPKKARR